MADPKFEESFEKLEAIVEGLESGEVNLDEAIKKYEEGMKLSAFCYKKLNEIQKKVEVLIKDASGKLNTRDFNEGEQPPGPAKAAQSQKKPTSKKRRFKGEELLF